MAGMGPAPKPAHLRQRRNRKSTAAKLVAPENPKVPALPNPGKRKWHKLTRAWWRDVWGSELSNELISVDMHALARLAVLIDEFYKTEDVNKHLKLMTEIRQQEQRFGLSPLDRSRLHWEIQRGEEAEMKRPRGPRQDKPAETSDPRQKLRAVK